MGFVNQNFNLSEEMINYNEIDVDGRESYFIPLDLSKIPKDMFHNSYLFDLIDEMYISMVVDSTPVLVSCDILGQTCAEKWNPKDVEAKLIEDIIQNIW